MNFNEYQEKAISTAIYPNIGNNFVYPALGLCGESGEVAEKCKKFIRDNNGGWDAEDREKIIKELGDVLWYVANLANEFMTSLEDIAETNIDKLQSRKERGKLNGSGDNR